MSIVPHPPVFCKKGALKNLQNFAGKYLFWSLFLIKLQAFMRFFCEICEIFKNTYFEEHLWKTVSALPRIYKT